MLVFRIEIASLRLALRNFLKSHSNSSIYLSLNFDNHHFTTSPRELLPDDTTIAFTSEVFQWTYPPIPKVESCIGKCFYIRCYEIRKGKKYHRKKGTYIGGCVLDLYEIATGPVRIERNLHGFNVDVSQIEEDSIGEGYTTLNFFQRWKKMRELRSGGIGRISLDVRMEVVRQWEISFSKMSIDVTNTTSESVRRYIAPAVKNARYFALRYVYHRAVPRRPRHATEAAAISDPMNHHLIIDDDHESSMIVYNIDEIRQEGQTEWVELETINDNTSFHEVVNSSVRVQLYRVMDDDDDLSRSNNWKLYGECWVPIGKLVGNSSDVKALSERESTLDTTLWLKGKLAGNLTATVVLRNIPESTQMYSGVNTENGVMCVSPLVENLEMQIGTFSCISRLFRCDALQRLVCCNTNSTSSSSSTKIPSELRKLMKLLQKLQETLLKQHDEVVILKMARELISLLRVTTKVNMLSYTYETLGALRIGREFFISLCVLILDFLDVVRHKTRIIFFDIIFTTLKRSELSDPRQFGLAGDADMIRQARASRASAVLRLDRNSSRSSVRSDHPKTRATTQPSSRDVDIACRYRDLLYSVFGYVTQKLNVKESFEELRTFCVRILVIAYFRLPAVASVLSEAILPSDETSASHWQEMINTLTPKGKHFDIPEWNDTESFNLDSCSSSSSSTVVFKNPASPHHNPPRTASSIDLIEPGMLTTTNSTTAAATAIAFGASRNSSSSRKIVEENAATAAVVVDPVLETLNWNSFHNSLAAFVDEATLKAQEEEHFKNSFWLKRLEKHGYFFYCFGEEYIRYVLEALVLWENDTIRWELLPGYVIMLKAFLLEMKRWTTTQYSESMLTLSEMFLANENLVSVFMKVIFMRMNCNSVTEVSDALDLLGTWLEAIRGWDEEEALWNFKLTIVNATSLPPTFDSKFLAFAINSLFDSEQNQILLNVMLFLYNRWDYLPSECTHAIRHDILKYHFFRLFSHWSYIARRFFHNLTTYHLIENVDPDGNIPKDIVETSYHQEQISLCLQVLEWVATGEYVVSELSSSSSSSSDEEEDLKDKSPKKNRKVFALQLDESALSMDGDDDTISSPVAKTHEGLHSVTGGFAKDSDRSTMQDDVLSRLSVSVSIPSFQVVYVAVSLQKFKALMKQRGNEAPGTTRPVLEWKTVVIEDTPQEQVEDASGLET